ncbi:choice-of-anchor Q domain-containing protein [Candidatus Margulisiibacteriota bacterium]
MGIIKKLFVITITLLLLSVVMTGTNIAFAADTLAPTIDNKTPAPDASAIPTNSSISFDVWDTESGVSLDTLVLKVKTIDITTQVVSNGVPASYNFTYDPGTDFGYGELVTVDIYIEDVSGNPQTSIYSFTTVEDTTPPAIANRNPDSGASDVPTNSSIAFTISDSETGVSIDSLIVSVNGELAATTYSGSMYSYSVTHNPSSDFAYGIPVTVEIEVKDISGNIQTDSYSFDIHQDTTPPAIANRDPDSGASDVPTNSSIVFTISDTETGVSIDSLIVSVNGAVVGTTYTGSMYNYSVTHDPSTDFDYGVPVSVEIEVKDISGNIQTDSYSFDVHQDTTPPNIINLSPADTSTNVSLYPTMSFDLTDQETGVNIDSLIITFNNFAITASSTFIDITGSTYNYHVDLPGLEELDLGTIYNLTVYIEDISGNINTSDTVFTTIPEVTPPNVFEKIPTPDSIDLSLITTISFGTFDEFPGIDTNSIIMTVNGKDISSEVYTEGDYLATINAYYVPTVNLPVNSIITVNISVSDSSGNITTDSWSFKTLAEVDPPTISAQNPAPGEQGIPINSTINFDVVDSYGVDISTLAVSVNGINVTDLITSSNSAITSYSVQYVPTTDFEYITWIPVEVSVDDIHGHTLTANYSFETELLTTVYVDINASPSGDGTIVSPFVTIAEGLQQISRFGEVIVYPGVYSENIVWPNKQGITLRSADIYAPFQVKIDGSAADSTIKISSSVSANIEGLVIQNGGNTVQGGGVFLNQGVSLNINNCIISGNAADWGAGIYQANNSSLFLTNSIIKNNTGSNASGIYTGDNVDNFFSNIIVNNNSSHGIYGGEQNIYNSIIWGNGTQLQDVTGIISYSIIQGGHAGTGNLSTDPLFVDTTNNDYRLQPSSLAIEAGTNLLSNIQVSENCQYDLIGIQRPQISNYDIGVYEHQNLMVSAIQPTPDSIDRPVDQIISFKIYDLLHSVASTSITVNVNSVEYTLGGPATLNITGSGSPTAALTITLAPTMNWATDSTINVTINAQNASADILSRAFKFNTELLKIYNSDHTPTRYYTDIQSALEDAEDDHTIWINDDTFSGSVNWDGSISSNITLRSTSSSPDTSIISANSFMVQNNSAELKNIIFKNTISLNTTTVNIDNIIVTASNSAGINITDTLITINRSIIASNIIGINKASGTLYLDNSLLVNNSSVGLINTAGYAQVRHCIVYNNGIGISNSGTLDAWNSIIWGNTTTGWSNSGAGTITYSDIQNPTSGTGNISSDPLFIDVANSDFHVSRNSPAFETGTAVNIPQYDFTNTRARLKGRYPDMGIYEELEVRLPLDLSYYYVNEAGNTENITSATNIYIKRKLAGSDLGSIKIIPSELGISIFDFDFSDLIITKNNEELPEINVASTSNLGTTVNSASPAVYVPLVLYNSVFSSKRPLLTLDIGFGPQTITNYNGSNRTSVPSSDYLNRIYNYVHTPAENKASFKVKKFSVYGSTFISTLNFTETNITNNAEATINLTVTVTDLLGSTVSGAPVYFSLVTGNGIIGSPLAYAGPTGIAQTAFGLPFGDSFHIVRASADGVIADPDALITGNALNYYAHNISASPNRHYLSIAEALADAALQAGHIISVDAGTYHENLSWPNKNNITLQGNGTVVLDGSNSDTVINVAQAVSLSIKNLVIQNGTSIGQGGGIKSDNQSAVLNMYDCIVSGNKKSALSMGSIANLNRVTFNNNIDNSVDGGAIYMGSTAKLTANNCSFLNNEAKKGGGFKSTTGGAATFNACYFEENKAVISDGGAGANYGKVKIINSIFVSNNALNSGGALYNINTDCKIINSTFFKNTAQVTGDSVQGAAQTNIINSILWNNRSGHGLKGTITVTYSDLQNWSGGGLGNITSDPMFINEGTFDLHLNPASMALDTATYSIGVITDFDGNSRPLGSGYDMGAYEAVPFNVVNVDQATGYSTIAQALASANAGETLEVNTGVYNENLTWPNINNITLKGSGFATSTSVVINGGGSARAIDVPTAIHLTIEKLTIRNGNATSSSGGGIRLAGGTTISLNNVIVSGNQASNITQGYGGGLSSFGGLVTVEADNSLFINNTAAMNGGAAALTAAEATFTNCSFVDNSDNNSNNGGGAIYRGNLTIEDCVFQNNTTSGTGGGGAIYKDSSERTTINNSEFINNSATAGSGGALYSGINIIVNSIFRSNSSGSNGNAITDGNNTIQHCVFVSNNAGGIAISGSNNDITNSIFSNNMPAGLVNINYSIFPGASTGIGNVSADPKFTNEASGDYSLLVDSPAIESGTDNILALADTDNAGHERPQYNLPDMGIFEYRSIYVIDHVPDKAGIDIPATTPVYLRIVDNSSTVDINLVTINFNSLVYKASGSNTFNYTDLSGATTANILISITPAVDLDKGKTYVATTDVTDQNGAGRQDILSFTIIAPEDVYISTGGNDTTGKGTMALPFATIQKGLDIVKENGTVSVLSGTYTENINWPNKQGVTLKGNTPNAYTAVILNGNNGLAIDLAQTVSANIYGLTITGGSTGIQVQSGAILQAEQLLISGNSTSGVSNNGTFMIQNSLVVHNGIGISNLSGETYISQVVLADNSTGIYNNASANVLNTIIWDNTSQINNIATILVQYSDIESGYAGLGNISVDPKFVNAGLDYSLMHSSPLIDQGTTSNISIDINGQARPQGDQYDIGAYEYQAPMIYSFDPLNNSQNVPADEPITLKIRDDDPGIDIASLIISINGTVYTELSSAVTYSGTINDYTVILDPDTAYPPETTVNVLIHIEDSLGNTTYIDDYSFFTQGALSTVYVSANAAAGGGGSYANPFNSIQNALNYLSDNNVTNGVAIAVTGNYQLTTKITWPTKPLNLTLKGISPAASSSVIIDAQNNDRVIIVGTFNGSNGTALTIEDLTIQNGNNVNEGGGIYLADNSALTLNNVIVSSNISSSYYGGGIYAYGEGIALYIVDSLFNDNTAVNYGGAIYKENGTGTIQNTDFIGNKSTNSHGGAIYNTSSGIYINGGHFTDNTANNYGGAIYSDNALDLEKAVFIGNESQYNFGSKGGAIYHNNQTARIINCIFAENKALNNTGQGAGIYNNDILYLNNNTFSENTCPGGSSDGGGLYNNNSATLRNNIFWGNTAATNPQISNQFSLNLKYSDIENWAGSEEGVITSDPKFISTPNYDFQLQPDSLAIETGTSVGSYIPAADILGITRPQLGRFVSAGATAQYDMGAYEKIADDNFPPEISDIYPAQNSTGNVNDTPIAFRISDTLSGVSIDTLQLEVDSQAVVPDQITLSGSDYLVTYNPVTTFNYNSVVPVTINVEDVSANSQTVTYSFGIGQAPPESTPPTFNSLDPLAGAVDVTLNPSINITIEDSGSGVSQDSIRLWVQELEVTNELSISGTTSSYQVSYTPSVDFGYGETVAVTASAYDLLDNPGSISYGFTIHADSTAPQFSSLSPTNGATSVSPTTPISLIISDSETGVSLDTIQILVAGIDLSASMDITGNMNSYTATLVTNDFGYLETIDLTVNAEDIGGNPGSISYSFQTIDDTNAPVISSLIPTRDTTNVAQDTNMSFTLTDIESGVSLDSIILEVNNVDVSASLNINGNAGQYTVSYTPELGYFETVVVTISAKDLRDNLVTDNFYFITEQDLTSPTIFGHNPQKSGAGAQDAPVNFSIVDLETGVSVDSVTIEVLDSGQGIITGDLVLNIVGSGPTYDASFTHDTDFGILSTIYVTINATDISGNAVVDEYNFISGQDNGDPFLSALSPLSGATNVSTNTTIVLQTYDNETGIQTGLIGVTVSVGGIPVAGGTVISGGPITYNITFTPAQTFNYNDTVQVAAQTADYGNPPNITNLNYSFSTETDTYPPAAPVLSSLPVPLAPATTNIGIFKISGSAEAGATVRIYNNGRLLGSSPVSTTGSFSLQVALRSPGYNTINATCIDNAGNLSPTSASQVVLTVEKVFQFISGDPSVNVTADITLPVGAVAYEAYVSFNLAPTENDTEAMSFLLPFYLELLDGALNPVTDPQFANPVIVTLNLGMSFNYPANQISIYYYNTSTSSWSNDGITIISFDGTTLVFSTTHFSKFAVVGLNVQSSLSALQTFVAPNPVNLHNDSIHFMYNINRNEANIKIYVYDISGQKIWETEEDVNSSSGEIAWDGKDQWGEILANGVYVAYIVATDGENRKVKRVKIAVLK